MQFSDIYTRRYKREVVEKPEELKAFGINRLWKEPVDKNTRIKAARSDPLVDIRRLFKKLRH